MLQLPKKISEAVEQLSRLPGVGGKSAQRHALFLSQLTGAELLNFSDVIKDLTTLKKCNDCGLYLDDENCLICSSSKRQSSKTLCVVEGMTDCLAIEASDQYFGLYHILGGVLNPLLGIGPDELRLDQLKERIVRDEITSVILAVNPSVEGDATCAYINDDLGNNISIERIGFGIPMGGSFEYLDPLTIMKALENRKRM